MLGARIAALRRQRKMSQGELAKMLNISPSAVGMYEQGRREPSLETIVDMARIFGVTADYLLTGVPAEQEQEALQEMLRHRLAAANTKLEARMDRPFSRQELAVLFAAMLME